MANVSIGLAQNLMVDRLIRKVRVNRTRSGIANYTDKLHHGISADILARKCVIGLDKANQTLQYITEDHFISYVNQLHGGTEHICCLRGYVD